MIHWVTILISIDQSLPDSFQVYDRSAPDSVQTFPAIPDRMRTQLEPLPSVRCHARLANTFRGSGDPFRSLGIECQDSAAPGSRLRFSGTIVIPTRASARVQHRRVVALQVIAPDIMPLGTWIKTYGFL